MLITCACRSQQTGGADQQVIEGAVALTLGGTYLFFCTGHFCEFAGLQYTAGALLTSVCQGQTHQLSSAGGARHSPGCMSPGHGSLRQPVPRIPSVARPSPCVWRRVFRCRAVMTSKRCCVSAGFAGVEDFDFYQSGALLALNTFGPHVLACLALPLVCWPERRRHMLSGEAAQPETSTWTALGKQLSHPGTLSSGNMKQPSASSGTAQSRQGQTSARTAFRRQFLLACLTSMLCRTLTALAATASAAIQRRHLMVWALFAPKFVFEAVTLLVCDAVLVLMAVML